MNNRKYLIAQSFDRGVANYDEHAVIQKQTAHKLTALIPKTEPEPKSILEIGCGTGYLTKILKEKYPNSKITSIDLSKKMIAYCQSKIKGVNFIISDGEKYYTDQKFDLIISNMTIQWFDNIKSGLDNLKKLLRPSGSLVFSGLGKDSFREWNQASENSGFISSEDYHTIKTEEKISIKYKSGLSFLKSIKIIGANQPKLGYKKSGIKNLKKSCRILEEEYNATVTWHIVYGHIKN